MTKVIQGLVFVFTNGLALVGLSKAIIPLWGWGLIALGSVAATLLIGIVVRAYSLEKALVPKVSISDPIEDHRPWTQPRTNNAVRFFSLNITNESLGSLKNCSVKEVLFQNIRGRIAPESGRLFPLTSDRNADQSQHAHAKFFDLRGKGDSARVDICCLDERGPRDRVEMRYATVPTSRPKSAIAQEVFPHYLVVAVTSENLPEPVKKAFKIEIEPNGHLLMTTIKETDIPARSVS